MYNVEPRFTRAGVGSLYKSNFHSASRITQGLRSIKTEHIVKPNRFKGFWV